MPIRTSNVPPLEHTPSATPSAKESELSSLQQFPLSSPNGLPLGSPTPPPPRLATASAQPAPTESLLETDSPLSNPSTPVPRQSPLTWSLTVPAIGREVFTPAPLLDNRTYRFTVSGVYGYRPGLFKSYADATFSVDEYGNFTRRYFGLQIAGRTGPKGLDSWTENRADHIYTCLVKGNGQRVPITLLGPNAVTSGDCLRVEVEDISASIPGCNLGLSRWEMTVPSSGREAFSPEPLEAGRVYRLTFTGTYILWIPNSSWWTPKYEADAIFHTDNHHNCKLRYQGVEVHGQRATEDGLDSWTEDRANHRYTCLVEGTGERVPVRVLLPRRAYSYGNLSVEIELLPRGTPSVLARQKARVAEKAAQEKARREESDRQQAEAERAVVLRNNEEKEKQAELQRQKLQAELAKRERELEAQVNDLKRMVHMENYLLEADYRDAYVKKYLKDILQTKVEAWAIDYHGVMANKELVKRLKTNAPVVIEWFEARLQMAQKAQRLAVLPKPLPAPVPITPHAVESIRELISELYRTQDARDSLQRSTADGPDHPAMASMSAAIKQGLEQLTRYGIVADSPEAAEQQAAALTAKPAVNNPYEEVREKLRAGESVGLDIVAERAKDLFREQCIIVAGRRQAIRRGQRDKQREFDERLARSRAEFAQWVDLLREQGFPIEFTHREQMETLEEGIVRLCQEKLRIKEFLTQLGDEEGAEAAEALYAEKMASMFKGDDEDYI